MRYQVFISYSTKNVEIAKNMKNKLQAEGIKCWKAPEDIPPGKEWDTGIVEGLQECSIMVLIFSKNADDSGNVKKELALADYFKKIVIPFKVDDSAPSNLAYWLIMPQWIEGTALDEESYSNLATRLKSILENTDPINKPTNTTDDSDHSDEAIDLSKEEKSVGPKGDSLIITEKSVIIRISKAFKPDMTSQELKQASLGDWSIKLQKAQQVEFAYVAHQGSILDVFKISDCYETETLNARGQKRVRFEGASSESHKQAIGKSIRHYFPAGRGAANPVKYLNI